VATVLQAQNQQTDDPTDRRGSTPAAERRSRVWQAIGFVNAALDLPSADALAILRARA
jgi:hypothetical protein